MYRGGHKVGTIRFRLALKTVRRKLASLLKRKELF
jgi:hypothetical protein